MLTDRKVRCWKTTMIIYKTFKGVHNLNLPPINNVHTNTSVYTEYKQDNETYVAASGTSELYSVIEFGNWGWCGAVAEVACPPVIWGYECPTSSQQTYFPSQTVIQAYFLSSSQQ